VSARDLLTNHSSGDRRNVPGCPLSSAVCREQPQLNAANPAADAEWRRLVIGREVDETKEILNVVAQALGARSAPGVLLMLLAGAWLSMRAQKRSRR